MDEIVKDLLSDVSLHEHPYEIIDKKIGYKVQDTYNFNIRVGYKTLFSYYKEKANVSPDAFKNAQALGINCGKFSYSEIPKNFFITMGVTGTLSCLSEV